MVNKDIAEVIGYCGAACLTITLIPQLSHTIKTKRVSDISYGFICLPRTCPDEAKLETVYTFPHRKCVSEEAYATADLKNNVWRSLSPAGFRIKFEACALQSQ